MGSNQAYKLLHSKGNYKQNEKTTYGMGENICKQCDWQEVNFKYTNSSYNSVAKKKNNTKHKPNQKWAENLNRHFSNDIQMTNRHMKTCSTLLIFREMQIKTILRYHHTLLRMAIIKKSTNNKWWTGCCRKWTLLNCCWCECKLVQLPWRTVWRFFKILELPYDPAIPLLGIHPEKMKTLNWNYISTPVFTAALFTKAKAWKQLKCLSKDERIKIW